LKHMTGSNICVQENGQLPVSIRITIICNSVCNYVISRAHSKPEKTQHADCDPKPGLESELGLKARTMLSRERVCV
jgi:hypothetical protein